MLDYVPINWAIIATPINWVIVLLMLLIAGVVLDVLFGVAPSSSSSEN